MAEPLLGVGDGCLDAVAAEQVVQGIRPGEIRYRAGPQELVFALVIWCMCVCARIPMAMLM